jgi:rubrerythrin
MAITGHACDGWVFWSVETATATPAPQPTETKDAEEEHGPAKKRIFRLPNQKGVPEGQTRWYCHDCGKSFMVATGETPQACPQGHQAS